MKYYIFNKFSRIFLYTVTLLLFLSIAFLFIYIFIDLNNKGFNIELSILWWLLYIFLLIILSAVLFSLTISQNMLLEDYLVISLGILGFTRIKYENIRSVEVIKNKDNYKKGIHIKENKCFMIISKNNLLKINLNKPVKIYYFTFFEKYADTIIFSTADSKKLITDIESKI
ncbi:hypothetical protein [Thermoanaerobacterium sp. RBIITD]|uniref:hypothetical protein n=1 Tax=Thermoanaerobacterium sp. RBIITD TaxID=1550240 RepID=UPI000BB82B28|nr:hypothetical protein [Thermoanaerobacterium sp. RBIITD]SNX55121.1 hypothetical protein SAMN05660242_2915 [Thermoanaerobacterium sp. RBIITD]